MLYETAGWIGMILVLSAFAMLASQQLDSRSVVYHSLNATGAFLMVLSTVASQSWPAVVLNSAWSAIGVITLVHILVTRRRAAQSAMIPGNAPVLQEAVGRAVSER
ncbi:hypothetical protein [Microbacterium sp. NPDC087589]|uniref:CBU_0592 family membrane protein n=1 Tax=Microbacterium sp. NPDC087589 TaxID=3364191 RepID=UPI003817AFB4